MTQKGVKNVECVSHAQHAITKKQKKSTNFLKGGLKN